MKIRSAVVTAAVLATALFAQVNPAAAAGKENIKVVKNFAYTGGTDLDFSGNLIYAGRQGAEGGVGIYRGGKNPKQVGFVNCPGDQNDVAVVKPGLLAIGAHSSQCTKFKAGVGLFDVKNPKRPKFLSDVGLPGGTHTLTVYPGKPIIYASPGGLANGGSVEQILDASNPKKLKVAATFKPNQAGCHDVTFSFKKGRKLAFCAGLTEVQIWDVKDPLKPVTIGRIASPTFFPHSAVATPDGKYVIVGDEAFGVHDCVGGVTGSMYAYDISTPEVPLLVGHFGPPRGATPAGTFVTDWCTAHNYNFIPGTRIMVASWYTGGTNVIDWTNPTLPVEIAYFQPEDADTWSSYWHKGHIYANDLNRGLDVLKINKLGEG